MALSFVEYNGDGLQTDFGVTFDYLQQGHVDILVDGVSTGFTWLNASLVQLTPAPAAGTLIRIRRQTPTAPLVDFANGSTLTEADLDTATLQAIYLAQEAIDRANEAMTPNEFGHWEGEGRRLVNLADPIDPQDAMTLGYFQTQFEPALSTVANNMASVITVANNIGSVNLVAANMAALLALAGDLATVATNFAAVTTVSSNMTQLIAIFNNLATLQNLNTNLADIQAVAGALVTIQNVNSNLGVITAVNNNQANINAVAANEADIDAVAAALADILAVSAVIPDIQSLGGPADRFKTIAELQAATVDAAEDLIYVEGKLAEDDGLGVTLKRVAIEPVHAGKVQSADGAWWELVAEQEVYSTWFGTPPTTSVIGNTRVKSILDSWAIVGFHLLWNERAFLSGEVVIDVNTDYGTIPRPGLRLTKVRRWDSQTMLGSIGEWFSSPGNRLRFVQMNNMVVDLPDGNVFFENCWRSIIKAGGTITLESGNSITADVRGDVILRAASNCRVNVDGGSVELRCLGSLFCSGNIITGRVTNYSEFNDSSGAATYPWHNNNQIDVSGNNKDLILRLHSERSVYKWSSLFPRVAGVSRFNTLEFHQEEWRVPTGLFAGPTGGAYTSASGGGNRFYFNGDLGTGWNYQTDPSAAPVFNTSGVYKHFGHLQDTGMIGSVEIYYHFSPTGLVTYKGSPSTTPTLDTSGTLDHSLLTLQTHKASTDVDPVTGIKFLSADREAYLSFRHDDNWFRFGESALSSDWARIGPTGIYPDLNAGLSERHLGDLTAPWSSMVGKRVQLDAFTVATLPAANTVDGSIVMVSDGDAGGPCLALSISGSWQIISLGATIASAPGGGGVTFTLLDGTSTTATFDATAHPDIVSGSLELLPRWDTATGATMTSNNSYFIPLYVPAAGTWEMVVRTTATGQLTDTGRARVYANTAGNLPGAALTSSVLMSGGWASGVHPLGISWVAGAAGWVWVAFGMTATRTPPAFTVSGQNTDNMIGVVNTGTGARMLRYASHGNLDSNIGNSDSQDMADLSNLTAVDYVEDTGLVLPFGLRRTA